MFTPLVQQNLQMRMVVERIEAAGISDTVMVVAGIIIAALILLAFRWWKKKKYFRVEEEEPSKVEEHKPPHFSLGLSSEIEKHLKEDERLIVEVLKAKQGRCSQATMRMATDFSKAKLSRLLMELEDRNVIQKEKEGKRNLVFLKG